MSRQDTIVSAPFTSRSTTKSPTESIAVFLFTPHNSQALAPLLMSQTLSLSHHLVDGKQLTATIAPPTTLVACLQICRLLLPLILRSNRPKNLYHCYRRRQSWLASASPNQSPRDPFAVLCRCRSIILEQSLQLCARLLFSISDNLLLLEQSLQLRA